jgi:uncharacterized damage-inducible protein DinB
MAFHNAWANHRLLAACARLTLDEFAATRTSFFPSIRATLNHLLTVDWYYIDALERSRAGRPPDDDPERFFRSEQPFARCAELAEAQRESDRRLLALCAALDDAALDRWVEIPRRSGLQRERLGRVLAHLFQHQIHHRGQVHAMLAGTSVPPPQLDEFFCENDAHLRAEEFRVLGFGEVQIWGESPGEPATR